MFRAEFAQKSAGKSTGKAKSSSNDGLATKKVGVGSRLVPRLVGGWLRP